MEAQVIHRKTIILFDHIINYSLIFQDLTLSPAIFFIIRIQAFIKSDHHLLH